MNWIGLVKLDVGLDELDWIGLDWYLDVGYIGLT